MTMIGDGGRDRPRSPPQERDKEPRQLGAIMVTYYGCTEPTLGRGVVDGSAYKDGMEYMVWRHADGWTLGACHEDVGLMSYWSGETRESLLDFAGIRDEYVEALN